MIDVEFSAKIVLVLLYVVPTAICLLGGGIYLAKGIRTDIRNRRTKDYYYPRVYLKDLVGYVVLSILPIINIVYLAENGFIGEILDPVSSWLSTTPVIGYKK